MRRKIKSKFLNQKPDYKKEGNKERKKKKRKNIADKKKKIWGVIFINMNLIFPYWLVEPVQWFVSKVSFWLQIRFEYS